MQTLLWVANELDVNEIKGTHCGLIFLLRMLTLSVLTSEFCWKDFPRGEGKVPCLAVRRKAVLQLLICLSGASDILILST